MDFISISLGILIIEAVFPLNSLILTVTFASIHIVYCFAMLRERWQIEHYCCKYNCTAFDSLKRETIKESLKYFHTMVIR